MESLSIKRSVFTGVVILFLVGCFCLGNYAGEKVAKTKYPSVKTVQPEPVLNKNYTYTPTPNINNSAVSEKKKELAPVQATPTQINQGNEKTISSPTSKNMPLQLTTNPIQEQDGGKCVKVHDGDTITVRLDKSSQKLTSVRLIGVDAPELVLGEFGETAASFTRSLLQDQKLKLVYDNEKYDKYGRTLAYIYLEDGTFINARLVEEGYAKVMSIPPNTAHDGEFEVLQNKAQKENCGIWADPPPKYTWRIKRIVEQWNF